MTTMVAIDAIWHLERNTPGESGAPGGDVVAMRLPGLNTRGRAQVPCGCSSTAEPLSSKQAVRVRFPSSALSSGILKHMARDREAYNAYMRQYMKDWYDRRHAEAVALLGSHCAQCPETQDLQFDHIDPATKSMTIAKMWTASEERFQAELQKCQLLCALHHLEKTLAELGRKSARGTHGTLSAYRYCGPPKCDACRAVKSAYNQQRAANSIGRVPSS